MFAEPTTVIRGAAAVAQLPAPIADRSASRSSAPNTTRLRVATYTRSRLTPAFAIFRVRSASSPGLSTTSTTTTSRSRVTARWEIANACLAASAWGTRMWSSACPAGARHVAAAMFTPASLIAAAASASLPGVFSSSMTRSNAMPGGNSMADDRPLGHLSAASWREPDLNFPLAADDCWHDPAVVGVAHQLRPPGLILGGVALLHRLSRLSEMLTRCLAVRAARLDVHDYWHRLAGGYRRRSASR